MRETLIKTEEFKDSVLGKIPVDWEIAPIEEKLEQIIDYRGKTPEKTNSGIPLITAKNVRDGYLDPKPREYIDAKDYDLWMTRGIPNPGDVLFTTEAPLGNVARVPNYKLALAQRLLTLRVDPTQLNSGYLFWLLQWSDSRRRFEQKSSGSTVLGIKQSVFRKIQFRFPPLSEQQYIAEILDAADEAIARTEALIVKLKQMKAGLLHDLLTRGLDENGELRDAIAHPEQFKDSPIGRIPQEWTCEKLQTLCRSPIRDFGSFSMTNLITFLDSGIPFLKSEMIEEENLNTTHLTFISENIHALLKKSRVYPGNILYSKIGSALGKALLYEGELGVCNSNAAIAKIDINESIALPEYVVSVLNSAEGKQRLLKSIISLLPRINLNDLYNFELALPSISEQQQIVAALK